MLKVHHLNNSRSQRILWLLEEIGTPYEIVHHTRDTTTNLAPPSLLEIHPLGKSPVIEDNGRVVYETGAIIEYICQRHGGSTLIPPTDSDNYVRYLELMHFSEGSAMLPIMLNLYTGRLGDAAAPLRPRIDQQLESHFAFIESQIQSSGYFVGETLTGADIAMSFPVEAAVKMGRAEDKPKTKAFFDMIHSRPAYQAGIEKGGPYMWA